MLFKSVIPFMKQLLTICLVPITLNLIRLRLRLRLIRDNLNVTSSYDSRHLIIVCSNYSSTSLLKYFSLSAWNCLLLLRCLFVICQKHNIAVIDTFICLVSCNIESVTHHALHLYLYTIIRGALESGKIYNFLKYMTFRDSTIHL